MPNTPNMNLPEPIVGSTPAPTWAQDLNDALDLIDAHDHSPGNGVQITPDGIDINADLSVASNNLTVVRSVNFDSQASPLALPADIGCIYVSLKDLYYNDEDGNQVRITQGGSIAGTSGSIANLSAPASATYEAMSSTFTWQSDVNTPAIMDGASVTIRELVANGKGVTLTAPTGLAADYALTLPDAPPATDSLLQIDSSGNLSASNTLDNDFDITGDFSSNFVTTNGLQVNVGTLTVSAGSISSGDVITATNGMNPSTGSNAKLVSPDAKTLFVTNVAAVTSYAVPVAVGNATPIIAFGSIDMTTGAVSYGAGFSLFSHASGGAGNYTNVYQLGAQLNGASGFVVQAQGTANGGQLVVSSKDLPNGRFTLSTTANQTTADIVIITLRNN